MQSDSDAVFLYLVFCWIDFEFVKQMFQDSYKIHCMDLELKRDISFAVNYLLQKNSTIQLNLH